MNRFFRSLIKVVLPALLCLQGCIIVPIPWGKDRISDKEVSSFTEGLSSKEDVLAKFGLPDAIWETETGESVLIYKWERLRAIMLAAGGYSAIAEEMKTDEALLVLVDKSGTIERIGKATKPPFQSYGEFLRKWLSGGT